MLFRASVLIAATAAITVAAAPADAGTRKRAVTPVFTPPDEVTLAPMAMPLSGVFLTSRAPVATKSGKAETIYYFNGRFPDRPDFFYIVRERIRTHK